MEDQATLARAVCEWLKRNGFTAPGIEFRFGSDLVQVIRDGKLVATFYPSDLV